MRNTACPGCLHPTTKVTGPNSRRCPECGDQWNTAGEGYVSGPVEEKITTCWYKVSVGGEWRTGFFHEWATSFEEFESGPGQFPAAIIEDAVDSLVHVVYAEFVSFNPNHPDRPVLSKSEDALEPMSDKMIADLNALRNEA